MDSRRTEEMIESNFDKRTPLITWLDVKRRFREMTNGFNKFPDFVVDISCHFDGTEITVTEDNPALYVWLSKGFSHSFIQNENEKSLQLCIDNTEYPIEVIVDSNEKAIFPTRYPLWHHLAYFSEKVENFVSPIPFPESLRVSVFHSFKGGVGRTTALMTHLVSYLEQNKGRETKILLIDSDLEAPGITYWLDVANRPTISFVRFLEAVHYPPSSLEATIQYCAAELRKVSISLEGHEIFVLPACIDPERPTELLDIPILPEHIARNPEKPWGVGDVIQKLATELKADLVLVDLRAGLSELSSPLLFDPRIEKFLVSTVAPQSVHGIALVLEKIALLRSFTDVNNPASVPTVILSLLTPVLRESVHYQLAIEQFNAAFPSNQGNTSASSGLVFISALFDSNLMCIRDFKEAIELTRISPLFNELKEWTSLFPSSKQKSRHPTSYTEQAKTLAEMCKKYIYAEKGESKNLLITDPLRNLGKHFNKEIPVAISIGAKGAGKTFNFIQLCRLKTWEGFLGKIETPSISGEKTVIFPLFSPLNLSPEAQEIVKTCRDNCFRELSLSQPFSETELRDSVNRRLPDHVDGNESVSISIPDWAKFWSDRLLQVFSISGDSLNDLNGFLISKKIRLVILIDGLEELFSNANDAKQRVALESLLRFPNRLGEITNNRLGIIEFVRSDYVRTAIQQNAGQFEDRYKAFALEWTAESFLRLAYWICIEAKLSWVDKKDFEKLSVGELSKKLHQLWGHKLGSGNSKEALTARWIFTALCDLNGRLQARDLIRFLHYAAEHSSSGNFKRSPALEDRVLLPEAIRKAVTNCSKEKVEEATAEISVLRQWADLLKKIEDKEKIVPFDAKKVGLTSEFTEVLQALQTLGIIFEDKDKGDDKRFYLPESYRSGLEFTLSSTGRPKVLALIQRNSIKLPF